MVPLAYRVSQLGAFSIFDVTALVAYFEPFQRSRTFWRTFMMSFNYFFPCVSPSNVSF